MMLIEDSTVPDTALPIEAFKAHLRLGTGFGEDGLQDGVLLGFLRAAIAAIEARTGKVLVARSFSLVLSEWRTAIAQTLPVAPVREIANVSMLDRLGEETTVSPDAYWLEQDAQRPLIKPRAMLLPQVPLDGSVRIAFTAGFAADFGDIPADLAQAVLLLAAHYYEFRHETTLSSGCMPFGVTSLIERYRTVRLSAGQA